MHVQWQNIKKKHPGAGKLLAESQKRHKTDMRSSTFSCVQSAGGMREIVKVFGEK